MTSHTFPPMGWYPDPGGSEHERYWDGERWTHNVRDAAETAGGASSPTSAEGSAASVAREADASTAVAHPTRTPARTAHAGGAHHGSARPAQLRPAHHAPNGDLWSAGLPDLRDPFASYTSDGVQIAGWWRRVVATLIDQVIVMSLGTLLAWPYFTRWRASFATMWDDSMRAGMNRGPRPNAADYDLTSPFALWFGICMAFTLVYLLATYLRSSGTVGNRLTRTKVVPADRGHHQGRLPVRLAISRSLTVTLFLMLNQTVLVLWPINCLVALFSKRKQTLHDMLTRTQVVCVPR